MSHHVTFCYWTVHSGYHSNHRAVVSVNFIVIKGIFIYQKSLSRTEERKAKKIPSELQDGYQWTDELGSNRRLNLRHGPELEER